MMAVEMGDWLLPVAIPVEDLVEGIKCLRLEALGQISAQAVAVRARQIGIVVVAKTENAQNGRTSAFLSHTWLAHLLWLLLLELQSLLLLLRLRRIYLLDVVGRLLVGQTQPLAGDEADATAGNDGGQ